MKYVIVGGVAGGATAAAKIRRLDEQCEIIIFEKGKYISYANCGLPYYIGGVIPERESLFVQTPESFAQTLKIDVRIEQEVIDINSENKYVEVRQSDGSCYQETFDKLLLSTGASAFIPPIEGVHSDGILTLRNVEDTDKITNYISNHSVHKAAVIGAGFVGLEMAENLHHLGMDVSIIEMVDQVLPPVDYSIAAHLHQHLSEKGVDLYLSEKVVRFEKGADDIIIVYFASGHTIQVNLVILSVGVYPNTTLAEKANIKIGETKGVFVNDYLETSQKDVYAVGDVIEFPHPLTGKPYLNYLANPANRQAVIAASNMVKTTKEKYEGAVSTAIAKVFDRVVGATGLAAKRLKKMNIPYLTSTIHPFSHAGYYPGAMPLTIKVVFSPTTGQLFGAQVVGTEGVDKRIDQFAMVLKKKGTIEDLIQLEQAYAPPFSSAKDPVALSGYVAKNILSGNMEIVTWRDLLKIEKEAVCLIDVRSRDEYELGSLDNAINIPLPEIRNRLVEIPTDKDVILFCGVGLRGYLAQRILVGNGYKKVYNLSGGLKTFHTAIAPIVKGQKEGEESFRAENKPLTKEVFKDIIKLDACGLQCPGPIMKVKSQMNTMKEGEQLEIASTDAAFPRDIKAWCNSTGNHFLSSQSEGARYIVVLKKGKMKKNESSSCVSVPNKGKTLIMFSDDFDKAIASFILANGAAATGQKTSIFFTFWGLNLLKKENPPKVKKGFMGKMFDIMLPKSSKKTALSKMNFGGMGTKMMRGLMKKHGVASLEELRDQALEQGVEFIACQMSMDLMGIQKEELIEEVTIGGVATYMEKADQANVNLFI